MSFSESSLNVLLLKVKTFNDIFIVHRKKKQKQWDFSYVVYSFLRLNT